MLDHKGKDQTNQGEYLDTDFGGHLTQLLTKTRAFDVFSNIPLTAQAAAPIIQQTNPFSRRMAWSYYV